MDPQSSQLDVESLIEGSKQHRNTTQKRRARLGLGVSLGVTLTWIVYVTVAGHWDRVIDNWASGITMIFGSFVAGSTPQGGGAVAFPVFTKVLEIPSEVARTFSLSIQTIGMGAASLGILINRRSVDVRAIVIAAPASIAGFLLGYLLLVDQEKPFGPSLLPGPYVKVTFTIIVATMAFVTYLGYRVQLIERRESIPRENLRVVAVITVCGFAGGITSVLVGSGADVFVYMAVVSLIGLGPRVGVATSVVVMTLVSIVGLILLGIADRQLGVELSADSTQVLALDGRGIRTTADGLRFATAGVAPEAARFDLFGLWLAAVPVVAWGAPLGSAVSSRLTDRQLVKFVVALAIVEFVSTLIFLDEIRTNPALALFGVLTLVASFTALWLLTKHRHRLLGLPTVDLARSVTRQAIDVGPRAAQHLGEDR
ncbi:MAG: sulfite exporter TauE/SafE family protein [Acidimicrobiales bacterium]